MVKINMQKAREIHRENLRRIRNIKLQQLDVEFMRAIESGDNAKVQEISSKKQLLRDAPAYEAIDSALDIEQLIAAVPPILMSEGGV